MYFKKLLHIVLFLGFCFASFANIDTTFSEANKAYLVKDFENALLKYQTVLDSNLVSENLYYNIANSYFQTDDLGKSILFYEKALKLNPNNKDAINNLAFVRKQLENNVEQLPDVFFVSWWKNFINTFSSNTWSWIAIAFAWFSVIAFAFYFFSKSLFIKKVTFSKAIFFTLFALFTYFISNIKAGNIFSTTEVIILKDTTQSMTAPSLNADKSEMLYLGTKLEILDEVDGFYKAKSSAGNIFWFLAEDSETI